MLLVGVTYLISALLQLVAGFSVKVAFEATHTGEDSDPNELVSTARDFESKTPKIPSNQRRAYMPSDEVLLAVYSHRYEISLSPLVLVLAVVPFLAAGVVKSAPIVVLILVGAIAAGAALFWVVRRTTTRFVLGLGLVTFLSICLFILLGMIFLMLGFFLPHTPGA